MTYALWAGVAVAVLLIMGTLLVAQGAANDATRAQLFAAQTQIARPIPTVVPTSASRFCPNYVSRC